MPVSKIECKHRAGLLQPIKIPKWKWEFIYIDFITKFHYGVGGQVD